MSSVAWGITGAGHLLEESVERIEELSVNHDVTVFLSGAAEEVLKMYGLGERLDSVLGGGYLNELLRESEAGRSHSKAGRLALGKYDLLVVSPCTSNTLAKMAHGVSDSLVTNCFAQAGKSRVPAFVVPVDLEDSVSETPYRVRRELCVECEDCPPADVCPVDAFDRSAGTQIVLERCTACGLCVEPVAPGESVVKDVGEVRPCGYGAVVGGQEVRTYVRGVDRENAEIVAGFEGVKVIEEPADFRP
ncbi:MAG: Dihydromethanopterin reductase (acceptor) [Methanonatronarchaeales archaeon]|nr:Dihydromethanopterin reductase (acceptor) [Methanonatronarchaeales archaeon]